MHIAIEGMDGVGKTTVGKRLADKLDFKFIEKPLHYLFDSEGCFTNYIRIRNYINEQVNDDVLRAWFYGLGNIFLYHKFEGENIITDRHLLSNFFWCGSAKTETIYKCLVELIGKPDYTFLLWATKEAGMTRLRNRDLNDRDFEKIALYEKSKRKMEDFLIKYNMKYEAIDTTHLSVNEVVNVIVKSLNQLLKSNNLTRGL